MCFCVCYMKIIWINHCLRMICREWSMNFLIIGKALLLTVVCIVAGSLSMLYSMFFKNSVMVSSLLLQGKQKFSLSWSSPWISNGMWAEDKFTNHLFLIYLFQEQTRQNLEKHVGQGKGGGSREVLKGRIPLRISYL